MPFLPACQPRGFSFSSRSCAITDPSPLHKVCKQPLLRRASLEASVIFVKSRLSLTFGRMLHRDPSYRHKGSSVRPTRAASIKQALEPHRQPPHLSRYPTCPALHQTRSDHAFRLKGRSVACVAMKIGTTTACPQSLAIKPLLSRQRPCSTTSPNSARLPAPGRGLLGLPPRADSRTLPIHAWLRQPACGSLAASNDALLFPIFQIQGRAGVIARALRLEPNRADESSDELIWDKKWCELPSTEVRICNTVAYVQAEHATH